MSLIPKPTQLAADLQMVDDGVLSIAEALNNVAAKMRAAHAKFWGLPTDRLLAVLNADLARTQTIFAANLATAQAVNGQLDALDMERFPRRAPTAAGREDIVFDSGAGQWVFVPPPEPEPEPEVSP